MPLTKEELLKPRIKCVIDYPGNIFGVDKILQFTDKADKEFSFSEEWFFIKDDVAWGKTFFDQYPLLFKKLEWYEEIKPEDMPEYVMTKPIFESDNIKYYKVSEWYMYQPPIDPEEMIGFTSSDGYTIGAHAVLPANESEYTAYINQKQPPNKP